MFEQFVSLITFDLAVGLVVGVLVVLIIVRDDADELAAIISMLDEVHLVLTNNNVSTLVADSICYEYARLAGLAVISRKIPSINVFYQVVKDVDAGTDIDLKFIAEDIHETLSTVINSRKGLNIIRQICRLGRK